LAGALYERDKVEQSFQLVLSGPDVVGTPVVDAKTTVLSLFEEAKEEVFISSYVFYQAAEFFKILAAKLDADPGFHVTFLVDLSHHRRTPNEPVSLIASSFVTNFRSEHWRGKRSPAIWHDPRCFESPTGGILHAKTVIIDRKIVFVTSANFTEAAQSRCRSTA
jgi:phosphatidylserine/phosphatidylglycerophosphate/cardiolipin synthase-like enzyme